MVPYKIDKLPETGSGENERKFDSKSGIECKYNS